MTLKSAWELASARTGGQTVSKLTGAQKTRLAELDRIYTAKIAECELELQPKIAAAHAKPDPEAAGKLAEMLRIAVAKLRDKLEAEKEVVRRDVRG